MSDKFWYVDRVEGEKIICENDNLETHTFLKSEFSFDVYEGAVLKEESDGSFSLDKKMEDERRKELFKMQQNLFGE